MTPANPRVSAMPWWRTPGVRPTRGQARWFLVLLTLAVTWVPGARAQDPVGHRRSPAAASAWSFFGTVVPATFGIALAGNGSDAVSEWTLLLSGIYLGPGLGHVYAGQPRRAFTGIAIRTGILAATYLALIPIPICIDECEHNEGAAGVAVLGLGVILTAVSVVADIASAAGSAHRTNAEHGYPTFGLTPFVTPQLDRWGVAMRVVF